MGHGSQKIILLVEDEAVTALAEKTNLQKYGYNVILASSGQEAEDIALSGTHIDLILMDIDLGPGIDGTETAELILKKKEIPVVFLSSHTDPGIVNLTEKITSYGYVVKNSGITVLDASIKMAFKLFKANDAVREKEKLLLSIADNYPNSFISIIEKDYTIGFSSGQEFKNLGLDPAVFKGLSINEIFKEHSDTVKEYYSRTFKGEECSFELSLNNQHQFYKTVPLYDKRGKISRILTVVENITTRKQTEEQLKESEEKFRQVYEHMSIGIAQVSLEFIILSANDAYCKMLGYTEDELIGKSLKDITHPESLEENIQKQHDLAAGTLNYFRLKKSFIHKNGSIVRGLLDANLIRDSQGEALYFLGSVLDITDSEKTDKKLRESQENFIQAQYIAGIGGFSWNIATGIVTWSEGMYKLLKYDPGEKIDYSEINEAVHHPDDLESITQWLTKSVNSGEETVPPREYRLVQKDGTIIHVQTKGRIAYQNGKAETFFGTCQDITLKKTMEIKLQESENRYRLLADNSADLVWTCGTRADNFPFTYINPAVEEMLGYTVEEFFKLPLQKLLTPGSLRVFEDSLDDVSRSGETGIFQLQYLHKNSRIVDCELWVKPVCNPEGRATGFQGRTIDITIRKMAEDLLAEQTASLMARVNELNCLYGLSKLIEKTDAPLEEIYQGTVNLLPPAWQYPLRTCAQLVFDKNEYTTGNYRETPWQLTCKIYTQNRQRGILTVGHLKKETEANDGPFLKEEKTLLNEIAERLGHITEHRETEAERKRLLEEKKIFLKEVHHRIKNNMAMVEGLLSLQVDSIKNPDAISALQNSINRVTGMRILYDKLIITDDYETLSVSQYINDLIDSIFTTFPPGKDVMITRDIYDFQLSSKMLFPLGIILNELLTNVLKYAFDTHDRGLIEVKITRDMGRITLSIHDNGKGLPEGFNAADESKGFGLLLVQMLTKQLRGTFTITGSQGTMSILEFDVD